ncbi:hypothetical protein [Microbacterium sp.]|uniref:hypothetical protein n=1 Tax=Microbacterium sp. TaxID=51671 RepID=UPI0028122981|nr:hypothetical protein [Microbacterium sp.]
MSDGNPAGREHETGPDAVEPGPVEPDAVESPAESPNRAADPPDAVGLSDAEATIADLDVPDPVIPEPEIPAAALAEPVIPPAPEGLAPALPGAGASADEGERPTSSATGSATPATRAARRTTADASTAPPPDPAVVPPPSGATPGNYRGWTIAIFSILIILLIGAVVLVSALLAGGVSPFPSSGAALTGTVLTVPAGR